MLFVPLFNWFGAEFSIGTLCYSIRDQMNARISDEVLQALIDMPEASASGDQGMEAFLNPPSHIQQRSNFNELAVAYREAHRFLNHVLGLIENPPKRILDFGCGWGRIIRLLRFSNILDDVEMEACDPDPRGLAFIDRTVPGVSTTRTDLSPPSPYGNGQFDLVYAYSVFSHLSPESHLAWSKELRRITAPGGLICVTTQGEMFLRWCSQNPEAPLPKSIPTLSAPDALERYRSGDFLYALWLVDKPDYGHAAVPRQFFEEHWLPLGLEIVNWDESGPQTCCTLKVI